MGFTLLKAPINIKQICNDLKRVKGDAYGGEQTNWMGKNKRKIYPG
jgi:hypothetical protein